jgi:imidazole glycerol-phosphate synthase subunit HisF
MLKKRLIASLLLRDGLIVQSFGFNSFLPIGRPRFAIEFVVKWDVDEIVLLDMSATPDGRCVDDQVLEMLSQYCYVPLTVGGGIQSVSDVRRIIRAGADKVSLNSHALARPQLITEIADIFGSQSLVVSMDCRKESDEKYQVYSNSGQKASDVSVVDWARQCEELGAGEILLNSIDRDGYRQGYDTDLIELVSHAVDIPVIACGGVGNFEHFASGITAGASAVAAANIFQHIEHSTILAKAHMINAGIDVRLDSQAKYDNREFDGNGRLVMLDVQRLAEIEFQRCQAGVQL